MRLHIVSSATVLSAVGVLLTLLGGTRRRPAQVLIALGVVCVLAAFCLDAGAGMTGDGAVSDVRHSSVPVF